MSAIEILERSRNAKAAYGIDFGVLAQGDTALIELNDGFSLGSYGLDQSVYADLIVARWTELMSNEWSITSKSDFEVYRAAQTDFLRIPDYSASAIVRRRSLSSTEKRSG